MHFPINVSGVEDSVENYQLYLDVCNAVMVFESYEILFFVCHSYLNLFHDFHVKYAFTHIFSLHILLLAVENVW